MPGSKGSTVDASRTQFQVANADARDELRNPDQVRKARKEEERKMEHLQRVRRALHSVVLWAYLSCF